MLIINTKKLFFPLTNFLSSYYHTNDIYFIMEIYTRISKSQRSSLLTLLLVVYSYGDELVKPNSLLILLFGINYKCDLG